MSNPPTQQTPFLLTTAAHQQRVRIDRFLQQALPAISRHKIHELIDSGLVLVQGKVPKKSYKVGPEERIEIFFRDQPPSDVHPEQIPLDILFEDESLLVVNKPQGMVTHPAHGHFSGTLVNALLHHLGDSDESLTGTTSPQLLTGTLPPHQLAGTRLRAGEDADDDDAPVLPGARTSIRPGIVHRLDKGTSGLLVIAKNESVHRRLTEQFSARSVKRIYLALVWGRFQISEGIIDAPLGRHPGDRKRFAVVRHGGKTAITTFHVEETFRDCSLLTLRLKTGRTHQIRAHMEFEGHPLFGDATYGGRHKRLTNMSGTYRKFYGTLLDMIEDVALHARTLGFVHPVTGKELEFSVSPPDNFTQIVSLLREDAYKNLDNV
jgi:23S rRNA pseudouridine1911/1915/1917 synthase